MNISFREYEEKDKELLLNFVNRLEEYIKTVDPIKRFINLPGFAEIELEETFENIKKNKGKILFVRKGTKEIGYIIGIIWKQSKKNQLEVGRHKLGEVVDIYLEEGYRNQGIGDKMLKTRENYFKKEGCNSMWVSVFFPNNNAHNFYKRFGFVDREIGMLKEI